MAQRTDPGASSLSVNFLLAGTELFGGTKVALQLADLLADRGHRVRVVSAARPPDWWCLRAEFHQVDCLDTTEIPAAEINVATFWTTLDPVRKLPSAAVHFCQGYEALHDHNRAQHGEIEAAYDNGLPALVVSAHLGKMVAQRFGRSWKLTPPPLASGWCTSSDRDVPSTPARILVVGPWEIEWKGVRTALHAVQMLRGAGVPCQLVRLSQWPLNEEERALCFPDEFYEHVAPADVPGIVRSCDLLLAPSAEAEGFGLPSLEAMACGVPVIASDVSCYRGWAGSAARLVAPGDASAMATAAHEMLEDTGAWRTARCRGRALARRYAAAAGGRAFEDALRWALSEFA